ncbi:TrkH family potassium uptake protein [Pseudotabrizicola sediminis]|uniref:Trk system potassium uptake protein n=1 Tax=Pseudotabrizicola sediminis TaxID=2486418 RepID=A0ABY2KJ14_9RHOB|nr:TrkH family potassium uptake protein [Pseudotabrizicola sediminis]TGD42390.1 TrkH family potassium uptake protein [Pseudotabrizicola sediminis]
MSDLRPVTYVIGLLVAAMGVFMLFPLALDRAAGDPNWQAFAQAAIVCLVAGGGTALASANGAGGSMSLQQIFLLTTGVWVAMPAFGALPLIMGAPDLSMTDALFESVSGMTTTGTTVIVGLDALPLGANLWRGILQWLGGLGIVIVALLFLPVMKVGGMQFFRSEGFDTLGKVLPRALDISAALVQIYVWLTVACAMTYFALGMSGFDAVMHALTTVSTGGMSSHDASFGMFQGPLEYAAVAFMLLGSLPFIRFVQLAQGIFLPIWQDPQVRAYLRWNLYAVLAVAVYEVTTHGMGFEMALRESAFNVVSTFSGTGYSSVDLSGWGSFPFVILIIVGLIGGCTSSTGCSVKVFRYLILFEAIKVQIKRLHNPSSVNPLRYAGRTVGQDVVDSVIVFFTLFILTFGVLSVALSLTGLEFKTAVTAAWTSIANVGPVFGREVGATGAVSGFPTSAKWMMMAGMLVGRLELLSVYVLFMRRFWQT